MEMSHGKLWATRHMIEMKWISRLLVLLVGISIAGCTPKYRSYRVADERFERYENSTSIVKFTERGVSIKLYLISYLADDVLIGVNIDNQSKDTLRWDLSTLSVASRDLGFPCISAYFDGSKVDCASRIYIPPGSARPWKATFVNQSQPTQAETLYVDLGALESSNSPPIVLGRFIADLLSE